MKFEGRATSDVHHLHLADMGDSASLRIRCSDEKYSKKEGLTAAMQALVGHQPQ